MAAVLAFAVDAGHLALHEERRPAGAAVHTTHRLVERAVAVVVLAALDVALRFGDARPGRPGYAVARRTQPDVGLALMDDRRVSYKPPLGRQPPGGCVEINE